VREIGIVRGIQPRQHLAIHLGDARGRLAQLRLHGRVQAEARIRSAMALRAAAASMAASGAPFRAGLGMRPPSAA
jgi:hypothetical protein